jgi:outer membrane protein OmpA-like peptidoglycan-associated protein
VSGSKITTSGTMNTPATSRIIAPAPAPALAPAPAAPMPEAGAKQSMNTEQGSAATQTAAAPVAPPAPEIPPRFTLTPPGSGGTDAAASSESTMPRLQLTPPAGMSTASGSDGGQPMLALGGYDQGGAAGIVNFAHGSARLSSSDLATLRGLAKEALERGMYMRVVGHASMRTRDMDPFEHALANFNVSVARANAVASALMEMGVPAEQLIVDAVGDTQPVYSEAMPSGEEGNRRTEIFLES